MRFVLSKLRLGLLFFLASIILLGQSPVLANEKPFVEIFKASPSELDLNDSNLKIDFELIVSHPDGILERTIILSLTNFLGNSVTTILRRSIESSAENSRKVTFRGSIDFPRTFPQGVYSYSIDDGVSSNLKNGFKISTQKISNQNVRPDIGLESGIVVRKNGFLDLNFPTFNGPAFGLQVGRSYYDSIRFASLPPPIWKVGESIPVKDYYELIGTNTTLDISTLTSNKCVFKDNLLSLLSEGNCLIVASTPQTNNYRRKELISSISIGSARLNQKIEIEAIPSQRATNLPIYLDLPPVRGAGFSLYEFIYPRTNTSTVCTTSGYKLKITSGGICELIYLVDGDANFLPSSKTQTIFIDKIPQSISFELPKTLSTLEKSIDLVAKASSGEPITYETNSNGICAISGSSLMVLRSGECTVTAIQAGTTTYSPISSSATVVLTGSSMSNKNTISCVKGKSTKRISGINPKCPRGFKLKV